jgi:tetrahydromethanopterin S-methyltransferase subunit C
VKVHVLLYRIVYFELVKYLIEDTLTYLALFDMSVNLSSISISDLHPINAVAGPNEAHENDTPDLCSALLGALLWCGADVMCECGASCVGGIDIDTLEMISNDIQFPPGC